MGCDAQLPSGGIVRGKCPGELFRGNFPGVSGDIHRVQIARRRVVRTWLRNRHTDHKLHVVCSAIVTLRNRSGSILDKASR